MRLIRLITLWSVLCGTAHADDAVMQRFRSEAPSAWEKLRGELSAGFQYESKIYLQNNKNGDENPVEEQESTRQAMWKNKELNIRTTTVGRLKGVIRVWGVNEDYAFRLDKETAKSSWVLSALTREPDSFRDYLNMLRYNLYAFEGLVVRYIWLTDLIASKDITILSASEKVVNDRPLVSVLFSGNYKVDDYATILGGTLWFDPQNYWTMSRSLLDFSYSGVGFQNRRGSEEVKILYQDFNGRPFPLKVTVTGTSVPERSIQFITDYGVVTKPTDESIFKLSGYGFPEPQLLKPSRHFTWIWINAIVVVLLVLAIVLRKCVSQQST